MVLKYSPLIWSSSDKKFMPDPQSKDANLIIYFGDRNIIASGKCFQSLRANHPSAVIVGCSTGTVISGMNISDEDVTAVALSFQHTRLRMARRSIDDDTSFLTGSQMARDLKADDLVGILVLSDGLNVNGSSLVAGIQSEVGREVPVGGGLAGDGPAFARTLVAADAAPSENVAVAIGFYGTRLRLGLGTAHGWDFFGPTRRITRSKGNLLLEMDDLPALDLYEKYLGEEAADLPTSALLYPLMITNPDDSSDNVVRTVLAVDRDARTMTFAGDVPAGWSARLMRGVFDNLTQGAACAAERALEGSDSSDGGVAILISCVGRRLLLGQRTADEIEATAGVLTDRFHQTGFYSYGEIATMGGGGTCGLHNQTMTVMTLWET